MLTNTNAIKRLFLIIAFCYALPVLGQEKESNHGFFDPNLYYDTRGHSELTINALVNFTGPFQYFGFVNYTGTEQDADVGTFFSEQTLRWRFHKNLPFDLAFQAALRNGPANDSYRLGLRWSANDTRGVGEFLKNLHFNYAVTVYALQAGYGDQEVWMAQIEHAYRFSFWQNRVYLSGFADQNLNHDPDDPFLWVTEHQLGVAMLKNFYAVAEFRINEYLPETTGVGLGLEYVVRF
ncbi:hypothetical protein [Reichenbachiella ulvae]|uniref:MetA-pathway of phenol degradation n=1 Tax=Reichenbachiella ulvae TaxID=2980104 RepID=A0ABT3CS45_9BACT|nr:hypothetical protein [Reichenbachiella ulvae]MCV9386525.1 hypothetical protein [Reichenbachiella ulvae]